MFATKLLKALVALSITASLLSGCAGCESEEDLCEGVSCEFGVCDPTSGECTNADTCAEDGECLEGFECTNDICIPTVACNDDGTCDGGECQNGACVNPDSCTTNANCVQGSWCDGGECVADPCAETTCERGVCQIGVGECVNADSCTTANQEDVCLDGFQCIGGSCVDETTFCDDLACDRGVCSFEEEACANAENCEGSDDNCLDGYFCDSNNTCQVNECDEDGVMCDRGVCDATTGDCVNADPCTAEGECTDGFLCVEEACVSSEEACGMGGCPGNQLCDYDGAALTATCIENDQEGCSRAFDCTGDRICDAGTCADPVACTDDAFEPNDADADATNYIEQASDGSLRELTMCGGDVDVFTFDTTEDTDDEGTLLVDVSIPAADVGLGTLAVEVLGPDGSSVAQGTNVDGATPTDSVQLSVMVDVVDNGVYTINVADDGDVSTAGVRYDLAVDLVPADIVDTCTMTQALQPNMPVVGTTDNAPGSALQSSCGDLDGTAPDAVFTLDVTEDSFVDIVATPQVGNDVALSLRTSCTNSAAEIQGGCADESGPGEQERVSGPLGPGTYYVLVESVDPDDTGSFVLSASVEPQVCTSADNSCIDMDTASVCNDQQTGFDMVTCDNGCDMATGGCALPPGDVCDTAIQVDAATGFSGTIDLETLQGDYDPGSNACVPDNVGSDVTGAADGVFTVDVPDGQVLAVTAVSSLSDDTSIYAVTDCADVTNSCLAGVNAVGSTSSEPEQFAWENDTGAEQTVFVMIDQGTKEFTIGVTQVDITVATPVCTPGERRCVLDRESQLCNPSGTGFDTTTVCDNGCDPMTGECIVTNDVCSGATRLTSGTTVGGAITAVYTDRYSTGACGALSSFDAGEADSDAVFVIDVPDASSTVDVDVTNASGFDPIIWVADTCDANDDLGPCLDGNDANDFSNEDEESLSFFAQNAGDYYIVIEDGDSDPTIGTFDIVATVNPPQCNPHEVFGCTGDTTGVEYCSATGQNATFTCDLAGCDTQTDACVTATGNSCFEAIELTGASGSETGDWDDPLTNEVDPAATGLVGQCRFGGSGESDGFETVLAVDLTSGDALELDFTTGSSTGYFYVLRNNCLDTSGCFGYDEALHEGEDRTFTYLANQAERLYIVIDRTSNFATSDSWTLDWSVSQPGWVCVPGSRSCADPTTVSRCADDGLSESFATCPTSCTDGACDDAPAQTGTCSTALDVGSGATVVFDPDDHTDSVDPSTGACNVDADGPDAFWAIDANAGDVIRVTGEIVDGTDDPRAYVFSDCADVEGTCLGAFETTDSDGELIAQAPNTGRYIIGLDSDGFDFAEYYYTFETIPPECSNGDPIVCNSDNSGLEFCENGVLQDYTCSGGCANDACATPRGDACFDTIEVTGTSGTIDGEWTNNSNTVEATENASCSFGGAPDGADDIYQVSLQAGDLFSATVDSDETALEAYILEDCTDADSCAEGRAGDGDPFELAYLAENATDVFLVIDRNDSDFDSTYTVDWEITQATCIPDRWACIDADTVGLCDSAGAGFDSQIACDNGCTNGACADDTTVGDDCTTAPSVGPGTFTLMSYDDYTNATEVSTCLAATDSDGPEKIYAVDLQANDILDVSVEALGNAEPSVYVFNDCADPSASCVAANYNDSKQAAVQYQATIDETVFVAVDDDFDGSNEGPVEVLIDVLTPDCDPAMFDQVCNMAGDGFVYCDATGFTRDYACQGNGVCDPTTARCEEPVGDVCVDPFVANPTTVGMPETFSGTLAGFTDDYDLGTGNMCTGSRTVGTESVYAVDLTAGQQVTIEAVSTAAIPEDIAVYATSDCANVRAQCLAGADAVGAEATAETFTYTAADDETIYVMVDSFFSDASGTFDLTVTVN